MVWLEKKSHVQHFKLSLAGEKLDFLEDPTYHREIGAWNEVLYFRLLSPNLLNLWDHYIKKKENVIIHIYIHMCLDRSCFRCNRKNMFNMYCMSIEYTYAYT